MIAEIKDRWKAGFSWKQTFTALRYPNYRLWFWGQMISLFGTWMQTTAQAFLVFELTRSPAFLGLAGFAAGVPSWLFMLYGGVVADRMSRRRLMIMTQTAMMVLAFLSAGLVFAGLIRPWHVLLLAFGFGIANAFDAPPRQAIVNELVEGSEDMTNAIALNSAMFNTATALGPAVGGVTYALFGAGWCFVINGLSFIAVIAALSAMRLRPFVRRSRRSSVGSDLREGIRYTVSHSLIRTIILLVLVVTLFGMSFTTLIPAWAVDILHGDAKTNGFLQSIRGLGALASALLIASLGRFKFRGRLLTFGSFAFPVFLSVFAFVRWAPLSYLILFAVGFSQIFILNVANAAVQTLTPDPLRGRVMSIYALTFFGSMPLGALFSGGLGHRFGLPAAVLIGAGIAFLFSVFTWGFMPKLKTLK